MSSSLYTPVCTRQSVHASLYTPAPAVDLFRLALADNRIAFRSGLVTMVAMIGLEVNPLLTIEPIL